MIDVAGLKQFLKKKGFDDAAVNKIAAELIEACPWISQPSSRVDESEAESRFHQLEAFFSSHGLTLHDLFEPEVDEEQWNSVYEGVVRTLESFGTNNELGDGDFWVIEDFYGTPEVLVEVHNEKVMTDLMKQALRQFLSEAAANFSVVIHHATNPDAPADVITSVSSRRP